MIRLFMTRAAASALSLEDRVFIGVSGSWLSAILTAITQQGPCQLQKPGDKGIWTEVLSRCSERGDRGQCPRTRRTREQSQSRRWLFTESKLGCHFIDGGIRLRHAVNDDDGNLASHHD